jgi:hypothetical protein
MQASGAERIYSVSQLAEALQSGLMGLKDQLQASVVPKSSSACCLHLQIDLRPMHPCPGCQLGTQSSLNPI